MYYVVRNNLGDETIIYPWRNGYMFVQTKHGYLPKPQSKSKTVERKWYKDDKYFHTRCKATLGFCSANLNWFLRDGYWWEKVEIKPKEFTTTTGVSVVKFDNVSLKDAIGSCFCEMDAYINTYPEAFIINKGVETPLNMEANNE